MLGVDADRGRWSGGAGVGSALAHAAGFVARCSIGSDPASFAMARAASLFLFILNAVAWTRILTELRDSGLFARVYSKMRDLAAALAELVPQNPALLVILAGDIIAGQPFNPPPVVAAVGRGRGRGRGAAAVGVPPGKLHHGRPRGPARTAILAN